MSQQGNQHIEIVSSNTTSDGKLSFHNGQPVIQFIIGEQERYLLGQSVRLVGNFCVKATSTTGGSANGSLTMDGRTSLYSTIDQLVIKSQATNQTIEHIRNYNRMMASILPSQNDLDDGLTHYNEGVLQTLNSKAIKSGVVDSDKALTKAPLSFSLPLHCGLLNGSPPIPLSRSWGVGGLIVEVHLAPDSNVLFNSKGGAATQLSDAFYEYSNVALVAEVQTPAPSDMAQLQKNSGSGGTFEYNSISSYYTTFNSTNAIINFSLGLSRVLSVFCNFITSSHINNRQYNGMTTYYPKNSDEVATIKQVVFTRGGERMPLDYNIDAIQKTDSTNNFPDAQIYRNYINAIQSFTKNFKNITSPETSILVDGTPNGTYEKFIDGGANVGVGVAFDTISNQGIDFKATQFGLQMDTDLTGNVPQSVYMFVKSKQTMVFSPQGIQVIA